MENTTVRHHYFVSANLMMVESIELDNNQVEVEFSENFASIKSLFYSEESTGPMYQNFVKSVE